MTTLRDDLYDQYVSGFKADLTARVDVPKFYAWCDHKIADWLADVPAGGAILELGCGPGFLLGYLAHKGYCGAEGIDLSREQVEIARANGHRAEVADVFAYLADRPGRYDLLVAFDFFEHFTRDELRRLTGAIRRALKPGGRLIIQTPNGEGLFCGQIVYGDLSHETILNPNSIRQLLALARFEDIRVRESGGAPVGWKGRARALAWRALRVVLNGLSKIATGRSGTVWTDNMLCTCRVPATGAGEPGA